MYFYTKYKRRRNDAAILSSYKQFKNKALEEAVKANDYKALELLLKKPENSISMLMQSPEQKFNLIKWMRLAMITPDIAFLTALLKSIKNDDEMILLDEALIYRDNDGSVRNQLTFLYLACTQGLTSHVDLYLEYLPADRRVALIQKTTEPTFEYPMENCFHYVVRSHQIETFMVFEKYLTLEEINELLCQKNGEGKTPWMIAVESTIKSNNFEILTQLILLGSLTKLPSSMVKPNFAFPESDDFQMINTLFPDGETALHKAVNSQNLALVEWLLDHGAKIQIFDSNAHTPLGVARKFQINSVRDPIADLLFSKGARTLYLKKREPTQTPIEKVLDHSPSP